MAKSKAFAIITCGIIVVILLFLSIIYFRPWLSCLDEIELLVVKVTRIRYGWMRGQELENIFTEELQRNIKENPDFYSGFFKKRGFYILERSFIKNRHEKDEDSFTLHIRIDDFSREFLYGYYQIVVFEKQADGKYLISGIGFDK